MTTLDLELKIGSGTGCIYPMVALRVRPPELARLPPAYNR